MAYIYQGLYEKWWLIYIKIYMTSDGLYISSVIWQVMAYTYEHLYDKWCIIYIKIYMMSDGLYI